METTGDEKMYALQPWSEHGYVRSFALAWLNERQVARKVTRARAPVEELRLKLKTALGKGKAIVAWNASFDAAWAINLGLREEVMRTEWLDAMLLWKHLVRFPESDVNRAARKRYGLKECVAEYYPQYAGYDEGIEFHGDLTDEQWMQLLKYNQLDAMFTLKLAEKFWNELRHDPQRLRNALIEAKAIPEVADHICRGMYVDVDYCQELRRRDSEELVTLEQEMAEHDVTPTVLASPVQLRKVLFEDWALPVVKRTDKGAPSTDKDALDILGNVDPRASTIARHRELGNLRTKFIDKILDSCTYNEQPVTHPTANMGGTYTGRMTFSSYVGKNKDKRQTGFAVHQMAADPDYRRQIVPPPGYTLIEVDAAGQEYRWMAIATGDETMLTLCEPGEDSHASMGADVNPEWEYRELQAAAKTDDQKAYKARKLGKVCNLSCQYRIGKVKFRTTARVQYGVVMSQADANWYHDTYHNKYRGVKRYWKQAIKDGKINGYARTFAGRQVQLNGYWNGPQGWMLESAAINFPIQGTGADQKYLAIAALRPLCTRYGAYFYYELHDGIYYIVPTKHAMAFGTKARSICTNLPYEEMWGFQPPIPLPWDLKMSDKSWGDMEEID